MKRLVDPEIMTGPLSGPTSSAGHADWARKCHEVTPGGRCVPSLVHGVPARHLSFSPGSAALTHTRPPSSTHHRLLFFFFFFLQTKTRMVRETTSRDQEHVKHMSIMKGQHTCPTRHCIKIAVLSSMAKNRENGLLAQSFVLHFFDLGHMTLNNMSPFFTRIP